MTNPIKISVAIAVLNEEKNIINLLESLFNQSIDPFEIIISDGGSSDNTLLLIKNFINNNHKKNIIIKLLGRNGVCRGSGRNTAINKCTQKYIALIDSGHVANSEWIAGFVSVINKNKDSQLIHGHVNLKKENFFSKLISAFYLGNKKHDGKLQYTVASMLITKKLWEGVGKFDESSKGKYIVEDLRFLKKLSNKNIKKYYSKSSYTDWLLVENFMELYEKYTSYSEGAINAGYIKVWHFAVFRNYLIYILAIILTFILNKFFFLIFLALIIYRSYLYLEKNKWFFNSTFIEKIFYITGLTYLLFIVDLAAITGFKNWLFKKKSKLL